MIHVIAIVTAKLGLRDKILRHYRANMQAVHAERGCLEYQPAIDAQDGGASQTPFGNDTFVVIEKWNTIEDLKAHVAATHMAAYATTVKDLLATRTIRVLMNAV